MEIRAKTSHHLTVWEIDNTLTLFHCETLLRAFMPSQED